MKHSGQFGWIMLTFGVAAWVVVGFAVWHVFALSNSRAAALARANETAFERVAMRSAGLIAQTTVDRRARLDSIAGQGVSDIIGAIEAVGHDANVTLTIGQSPDVSSAAGKVLHSVGFIVELDGSFGNVMRGMQMLASLPIPSTVTNFDLTQTDAKNPRTPWRGVVRIQLFTSAPISS